MKKIRIIVAAHKSYELPTEEIYLPLQVGAAGKAPIENTADGTVLQRDDTGEQISAKNPMYCELTGLYWAWKNLDCDYCGLVHYRRHFLHPHRRGTGKKLANLLDETALTHLLSRAEVVVPKKRRYYIETLASHYAHTHEPDHLVQLRETIRVLCPEYEAVFAKVLKRRSAHMFNMFIMRKDILDAYCAWLFPILDNVCMRIDDEAYDAFSKRYPGRLSELLLDVWLTANGIAYVECPTGMVGRVHWGRKIASFLGARFFGRSYRSSF